MSRTIRIGLTGPIGCGKSTVAAWLAELGAVVVDADSVARDVTAVGEPAVDAIVARFGEELRRPDGSLDRPALGRIAFADPVALRDLEAIVHPAVRPVILAAVAAAEGAHAPAVVIEAIKLVESGLADTCDEVWLVACAQAEQWSRLRSRGLPDDDIERRISAQGDLVGTLAPHARRVVDTSGPPDAARERVRELFAEVLSRFGAGDRSSSVT